MFFQNYLSMGIISILWFLVGFSLCFGDSLSVRERGRKREKERERERER
jgi:ammonia channel protein AmtB